MSHGHEPVELRSALPDKDLDGRRQMLKNRLDDGFRRIDEAVLCGTDVTEWESFWLRLLGEYEDVCRELDQAA